MSKKKKLILIISIIASVVTLTTVSLILALGGGDDNNGANNNGSNDNGAPEHSCSYSGWVTVLEPDCENDGRRENVCSVCGEKKVETIEAYGHTYSASLGEFVPDGDGFVYQKGCVNVNCNGKLAVETDSATVVTDPTCETKGSIRKIYTAVIDGITYQHEVETVLDTVDHSYSYATGSWSWNGYDSVTYTVRCGMNQNHTASYTAQISSVTNDATCTDNGSVVYTASVTIDGETYTNSKYQTIYKTNHNYDYENGEWVWSDTACATYVVHCTNDPTHTVTGENNATVSVTSQPTCENGGSVTYTVRVYMNGKYYTDTKTVETDPLGHDYKVETATWQWYDEGTYAELIFTCNNGTPHNAVYVAEIEYNYIVQPDCQNGGLAHAKATVVLDGVTYNDEYECEVGPIDHVLDWENLYIEWEEGYTGAYINIPCTLGEQHNYVAYATATYSKVYPDCYDDGYELYEIEIELFGYTIIDEYKEILPATGHNYVISEVIWDFSDTVYAKIELECQNNTRHTTSGIEFAESNIVVEPSCTVSGVQEYVVTIMVDGKSYTATTTDVAPKTGHRYGAEVCYDCGVPIYSAGLEYEPNANGTGYVLKGTGAFVGEILSIPDTYNGLPVVSIKSEAFKNNTTIKELYVSENITYIGYAAFMQCTSLEKIYFTPNEHGVLDIDEYAFAYCSALKTLDIGSDVKNVRSSAFSNCVSLTSLRIAAKNIYDNSFFGCTSLRSIELLDGVEYLGKMINEYVPVFSLTIPSTVTGINTALFSNPRLIEVENRSSVSIALTTTLLNVYTATEGQSYLFTDFYTGYVLFEMMDKRYLMGHSGEGDTTMLPTSCNGYEYIIYQYALVGVDFGYQPLYIPDSVTQIYRYAAYYNETLTVIWGCENVTDIGVYAFSGCSELLSVTLGPKLTKIYDYAFNGCNRVCELINHSAINVQGGAIKMFPNLIDEITDVSVTDPAIYFVEDDFVFYYRGEKCYLVSYFGKGDDSMPGQLTLPTLPEDWALDSYGIYKKAIRAIDGVTKIKLSYAVDQICSEAFTDTIEKIEIPVISSLKRIEENAFKWTVIEEIFLPSSLEYIGKTAFPSTLKSATFGSVDGWKTKGLTGALTSVKVENLSDSTKAAKYLLNNKNSELVRPPEENN